jgi:hypothetical protein
MKLLEPERRKELRIEKEILPCGPAVSTLVVIFVAKKLYWNIFNSPINRDFRFAPTGLSALGKLDADNFSNFARNRYGFAV